MRAIGLRRYRAPAALMLLLHVAGCTTMQPIERPYEVALPQASPETARVVTMEGYRVTVGSPEIEGDEISGERLDDRNRVTGITWEWPLDDIRQIEVRKVDVPRSVTTVLLVAIGVAALAYGVFLATFEGS